MTPEAQGAKQEPDFAAIVAAAGWSIPEPYLSKMERGLIRAAFAAGQACPAKPGGDNDWLDAIDSLTKRIATLEAALRDCYAILNSEVIPARPRRRPILRMYSIVQAALASRSDAGGDDGE